MTKSAFAYGTAIFDLALEENKLQTYHEQMEMLQSLLEEHPDLLSLLSSRAIAMDKRLEVLDTCFRDRIEPYLLNYLKLLCEKGAVQHLPECIRQFRHGYNEYCGIVAVKAVSAAALSPALQEKLREKLKCMMGKTIELTCQTDPSVLGGIRLSAAGLELDGTVRSRLNEVSRVLDELVL